MHAPFFYRCVPIQEQHPCLSVSARNSLFEYPQRLPGGVSIPIESVQTSFSFLKVTTISTPDCETAFRHVICLASNPPCSNTTDLLLPVCEDSCSAFTRLSEQGNCDSVIRSTEQLLVSPDLVEEFQIFFTLISEFDCRNASTYYFVDGLNSLLDSQRCTGMFSPQETGEST